MGAQPARQLAEVPDLAQVNAELEQAVLVQRQGRAAARVADRRMRLDRVVVGDQHRQAAVGDPLQQLGIATVEHRTGLVEHRRIRLAGHLDQGLGEAGVQAQHVAGLDHDLVGLDDAHQAVVADQAASPAQIGLQVDHHAAALDAACGHVLDAQRSGLGGRAGLARRGHTRIAALGRRQDVATGPEAVVVHRLGNAVAIGVEHLAHMRQAVPLGGVLQVHHHQVVADHVGVHRVVGDQPVVHVRPAIAQRGPQHRRQTPRVEHVAAGQV